MKVKSFFTTYSYKDSTKIIKRISKQIDAALIVRGKVWNYKDSIQLSYDLVEGKTERSMGGNNYILHGSSILTLSDKVVEQIANDVGVRILSDEKTEIKKSTPTDPEAFLLYLGARSKHIYGILNLDIDALYQSNDILTQAIEIDPNFAKAYSLIAWNYVNLGWSALYALTPQKARELALPAIRKSIELDPNFSDSYLILGTVDFFLEWDIAEAEKNFTKAMEIRQLYDRPTPYCFCGYAHFLIYNRRFDDAVELVEKIKNIDPSYVYFNADLSAVSYFTNQLDEAIPAIKKTIIGSNENIYWFQLLGRVYIQKKEFQNAIETDGFSIYKPANT